MQTDHIPEWALTPAAEAEIHTLLTRAFNEDFGGRSYHQQRHHMRIIARDPGIVGHMALCYRDIRMGEDLVPIIGLAEVCTDPDRQGEGIASRLMQDALAFARQSEAVFFLLFGDEKLYAGVGFEPKTNGFISTQMYGARTGETVTSEGDKLMVLPLTDRAWDDAAMIDLLGINF